MLRRSKTKSLGANNLAPKKSATRRPGTLSPDEIHRLIEARAFELYRKRGERSGDPVGDWLRAENQIKTELRLQ